VEVEDVLISSPLLDLTEGAKYLKISNRALRDLCRRKAIRHTRLHHRAYRFRLEHLDAYLNRLTVKERGW
jgi:excisionase family DNA binding protein